MVVCAAGLAFGGEIDTAKGALRDGLYEVARTHAAKAEGDEAQLVIIESYARQGKWAEVLKSLESLSGVPDDIFVYYRALALSRTDRALEAASCLDAHRFSDPAQRKLAALLRAQLAQRVDDASKVIELSAGEDFPSERVEARMIVAWARDKTGDRAAAEKIWREILADEKSDDAALASAATGLGDEASLRNVYSRVKGADQRRVIDLRLGRLLLADEKTFAEGAKRIVRTAKEAAETSGARECFLALAESLFQKERYQDASDAYREALESWPEMARQSAVQENRGWALWKAGRCEEALAAFDRAEEVAEDDASRARILLAQGDVLSGLHRGEESRIKYRLVLDSYGETPSGKRLKDIFELRELEEQARALYRSCCFVEAQEKFAELARRDAARRARMEYLEVLCLYGQGRDDEAAKKASQLAKESSDATIRAESTLWLAKFSYNNNRWQEACELFGNYATNLVPASVQAPVALTWAARASILVNEPQQAVNLITTLVKNYPEAKDKSAAWLVQGQALIALGRHDEAISVLDKVALPGGENESLGEETRGDWLSARRLRADALLVMGADNPARYDEALKAYQALLVEVTSPDDRLEIAFKIAQTYEKLKRMDEAIDQYYSRVLLAYYNERANGVVFSATSRQLFVRAGYWLDKELRKRGLESEAAHVLRYIDKCSAEGSAVKTEVRKRLQQLEMKGIHL